MASLEAASTSFWDLRRSEPLPDFLDPCKTIVMPSSLLSQEQQDF